MRVQVGFISKSLVKGSIKNHLKDSADFLVNPTKYPSIQTESTTPISKESYTIDSPDSSPFSIITDLIQAGRKNKDRLHQPPAPTTGKLTSQHNDLIISHSKVLLGLGRTGPRSLSARTISRSKRCRTSQATIHSKPISIPNSEGLHTILQGNGAEGQKLKGVN